MVAKTHGMLMSGEMIRAYQAGLKWQTRRTRGLDEINKSPDDWEFVGFHKLSNPLTKNLETPRAVFREKSKMKMELIRPPYGGVGDTLWFKETHALICKDYPCDDCNGYVASFPDDEVYNTLKYHDLEYRADTNNRYPGEWPEDEAKRNSEAPKWIPSIFMKHEYSRFRDIPILNVQVEQVKQISTHDCQAEGVGYKLSDIGWHYAFGQLWNSINEKRGLGWDVNPWVWVYEFPVFDPPQSDKEQVRHVERGEVRS